MTRPHTLWEHLKASASLVKSTFLDEMLAKVAIETPLGSDFLECQLRQSRKSTERYIVLKAKGGEATVYVPMDEAAAKQLVDFIDQSFLSKVHR